jgi:hypothetical protein
MTVLTLSLITAIYAVIVPIYFGHRKPGYSHVRHTISELGEVGSPVERGVALFGFVPIGVLVCLLLLAMANSAPWVSREMLFMLSLVGAAYVGAAIFPSDPDAPMFGTWRNGAHNVLGTLEYLGAAGAFLSLERDEFWEPLSSIGEYSGIVVLACLGGLGFAHPFRGLVQRIAETIIFAGMVVMAWFVYKA